MMNEKMIQKCALFLICLVLTLPFYSANVFASINTYSVNSNGARNYRAATTDQVSVVAEISGSTSVAPSDVKLITGSTLPFNQCAPSGGNSVCIHTMPRGEAAPGSYRYTVSYQSEFAENTITVDSLKPTPVIQALSGDRGLFVTYSASDRAFNAGDATTCSGVRRIEFRLGGSLLRALVYNDTDLSCEVSGSESLNAPSSNGVEQTFCMKVFDAVSNSAETCELIVVDKDAPVISTPVVTGDQNQPIRYISPSRGSFAAGLQFTTTENSLESIFVDASALAIREDQQAEMRNLEATCAPLTCDGVCTCTVPAVIVNLPAGGSPVLKFFVNDTAGNYAERSVPVTLGTDSAAPSVSSMTATQCGSLNVLGPSRNTIRANIFEADSGLGGRRVYLDLSSVNSSYSRLYPNACTQSGPTWLCSWGEFAVPEDAFTQGASIPVSIVNPSQDDAGNMFVSSASFTFDKEKPKLSLATIIGSSGQSFGEDIKQFPVAGGALSLTLELSEALPGTIAYVDFTQISPAGIKNTTCSGQGKQTCSFTVTGLIGPQQGIELPVFLQDCAGNINQTTVQVNVSGISTSPQDYWTYSIGQSTPSSIDRQTLSIYSHRSFVELIANLNGASVSPIVQQITKCSPAKTLEYFEQSRVTKQRIPDLINAPAARTYARFNIERTGDPPATVSVNCEIKTISRTSAGIISPPEYDNATFSITFANSKLGTFQEETKNKIKAVRDSGLVKAEWIGSLQKIFDFFNKLCNIWNLINTLLGVLDVVGLVMGVLQKIPYTKSAGDGYEKFLKGIHKGLDTSDPPESSIPGGATVSNQAIANSQQGKSISDYVSQFCGYVTCSIGLIPGWSDAVKNVMGYWTGAKIVGGEYDPRQSLIISTISVCLPGMIYNLQKARGIECSYLYCMAAGVSSGLPQYYCDFQRSFAWCKYVIGEIFQLVPMTDLVKKMMDYVKNLPKLLITGLSQIIIDSIYKGACGAKQMDSYELIGKSGCYILRTGPKLAASLAAKNAGQQWDDTLKSFQDSDDLCDQANKALEEAKIT